MPVKGRNKILGSFGESYALRLLQLKGYKVIDKNFRSKFGEIDIIAVHKNVLVFVEVKTRKSLKFGYPQEAISSGKIFHIKRAGEYYTMTHQGLPLRQRIDVVALVIHNGGVEYAKIINVY